VADGARESLNSGKVRLAIAHAPDSVRAEIGDQRHKAFGLVQGRLVVDLRVLLYHTPL
jgi:hypothetical protein